MQKIIITFLFLLNCCINYLQAQNVGIGLGNGVFPVHKLQVNDGNIGLYNSQDDKLIKFEYDPILNYFAIKEATGVNGVGLNRMLFQDGMVGIGKIPI